MKAHHKPEGLSDVWLTPPDILHSLGPFDLDPAGFAGWTTAIRIIQPPEDGLMIKWTGRVWLNPPFNRYQRPAWMQRMPDQRQQDVDADQGCDYDQDNLGDLAERLRQADRADGPRQNPIDETRDDEPDDGVDQAFARNGGKKSCHGRRVARMRRNVYTQSTP